MDKRVQHLAKDYHHYRESSSMSDRTNTPHKDQELLKATSMAELKSNSGEAHTSIGYSRIGSLINHNSWFIDKS